MVLTLPFLRPFSSKLFFSYSHSLPSVVPAYDFFFPREVFGFLYVFYILLFLPEILSHK